MKLLLPSGPWQCLACTGGDPTSLLGIAGLCWAVTLVPAPGAAASASPSASMCFWMGSLRFLASTSHPSLQWFHLCLAAQDEGVEAEDTYSRGTGNCRISTHSARKAKITREPLQLVHDNCHGEEWDSRPGWSNDQ